jgi:hypothetical protein
MAEIGDSPGHTLAYFRVFFTTPYVFEMGKARAYRSWRAVGRIENGTLACSLTVNSDHLRPIPIEAGMWSQRAALLIKRMRQFEMDRILSAAIRSSRVIARASSSNAGANLRSQPKNFKVWNLTSHRI